MKLVPQLLEFLSPPINSATVMSALNLVEEIQAQIVCTNGTQIQVEELISVAEALIGQAQADINEVSKVTFSYQSLVAIMT